MTSDYDYDRFYIKEWSFYFCWSGHGHCHMVSRFLCQLSNYSMIKYNVFGEGLGTMTFYFYTI